MSLLDEPTRIFDGIIERAHLDGNGGISIEYTKVIDGQRYSLHTPIKSDWLKYPDVIELVRNMAKGYFDMLSAI